MSLELSAVLIGAILLTTVLLNHRQLARAARRTRLRRPRLARYPSVTVVRPVKGLDVGARENVAAALDTGYPGEVEILFVFDGPDDPVVPVVRAAMDAHRRARRPERVGLLYCGAPPPGMTGKLNAMMVGAARARGQLIAFGDSDTRPDRDALRVLVETLLADPETGCAFAPVVVPCAARTAGDVGYALMLNALYGPAASSAASEEGQLPFVMGQYMVMRREALAEIGGLRCAMGQLVDDMHIGACLNAAGMKNVMSPHSVPIIAEGMSLPDFGHLAVRWLAFSRTGLPFSFNARGWLRGLEFWLALTICVGALVNGHVAAALLPGAVVLAVCGSLVRLNRLHGGGPIPLRHAWMVFALLVLVPVAFVLTLARREVLWRGRTYRLNAAARLA